MHQAFFPKSSAHIERYLSSLATLPSFQATLQKDSAQRELSEDHEAPIAPKILAHLNISTPWVYLSPQYLPLPFVASPVVFRLDDLSSAPVKLENMLALRHLDNQAPERFDPKTQRWTSTPTVLFPVQYQRHLSMCQSSPKCAAWLSALSARDHHGLDTDFFDTPVHQSDERVQLALMNLAAHTPLPEPVQTQLIIHATSVANSIHFTEDFFKGSLFNSVHNRQHAALRLLRHALQDSNATAIKTTIIEKLNRAARLFAILTPSLSRQKATQDLSTQIIEGAENQHFLELKPALEALTRSQADAAEYDCVACRCVNALFGQAE